MENRLPGMYAPHHCGRVDQRSLSAHSLSPMSSTCRRIGPGAPAFLTPEAAGLLSEKFGLKIADTKNPESEIQAMLAGH